MADDWDDVYNRTNAVNVKGTVNCVRAALPGMMQRGDGRIVLVGSLAGRSGGLLSGPHYVASKGAVGALLRWFAARARRLVNGVAPGPVDTGMIAGRELNLAAVTLGRIARPEEIASTIAFLCSPARVMSAASCLDVNGGVYMAYPSTSKEYATRPARHAKTEFGFRRGDARRRIRTRTKRHVIAFRIRSDGAAAPLRPNDQIHRSIPGRPMIVLP